MQDIRRDSKEDDYKDDCVNSLNRPFSLDDDKSICRNTNKKRRKISLLISDKEPDNEEMMREANRAYYSVVDTFQRGVLDTSLLLSETDSISRKY